MVEIIYKDKDKDKYFMGYAKKRYAFIDIAKGLAILSVVCVHITRGYRLLENGITWHLSVFFILTGILLAINKKPINIKNEFKKNIRSLLKPYWILSCVYIILYSFISLLNSEKTVNVLIKNVYLTLSGNGIGTLWFLPTMFGSKMLFIIFKKLFDKNNTSKFCFCLIVIAILTIYLGQFLCAEGMIGQINYSLKGIFWNEIMLLMQIFIACGYISLGYLLYDILERFKNRKNEWVLLTISIICFVVNYMAYKFYSGNNLLYVNITNGSAFIFCTVIGAIAVISLSLLLDILNCKLLAYCGKYSLIIMTTHLELKITSFAEYIADLFFDAYTWGGVFTVTLIILAIEFIIISLVIDIPIFRKIYNVKDNSQKCIRHLKYK